mgnify:CR=1 FL=1
MNNVKLILLVAIITSCTNAEVIKVDIKDVDPKILRLSNKVATNFFEMSKHDSTWYVFKDLNFISPGLYMFFRHGTPYVYAPMLVKDYLGEVDSFQLFQVYFYKNEKYFRYRIKCTKQTSPSELRVRINQNKTLNRLYLYVKDENGEKIDLLRNEEYEIRI